MKIINGLGVSEGYAIGILRYSQNNIGQTESADNLQKTEKIRYQKALEKTLCEFSERAKILRASGDAAAAEKVEYYAEIAADADFSDGILFRILRQNKSAEVAVFETGLEFSMLFEQMDGDEMKARGADFQYIVGRIKDNLSATEFQGSEISPHIAAAVDFLPSLMMALDRKNTLACVSEKESVNGHTAVLARSFGIPAVMGVGEGILPLFDGKTVIVDGFEGKIIAEPDEITIEKYKKMSQKLEIERQKLDILRNMPDITADGHTVKLHCNIQSQDETVSVLENGADGIGLFRSEFLFLGRNTPPSEEEQYEAYRKILCDMKGGEVTVRTFDIGADKKVPYIDNAGNGEHDARGLKLELQNPQLMRTQLRALYRASAYGNLRIMFPMVSSLGDIKKAKEICLSVIEELKSEKVHMSDFVPLGIMIETPEAAKISNILADEADFFSCGTNDLTLSALDGENPEGESREDTGQGIDTVYKLLDMIVNNAHAKGISVGVCGSLASDTRATEKLIVLGVDELSVIPSKVLYVREQIRKTIFKN